MYWKITELKDDVAYIKDDLNISPINSLKEAQSRDDIRILRLPVRGRITE